MRTISGLLCMLMLLSFSFTACAQKVNKTPPTKNIGKEILRPDSTISANLGKIASLVLFSPDKVNVYTIKPKKKVESNDYEVEPHYVRDVYVGNLDKQMIGAINYMLISDPRCYANDSIMPQTFYMPVIELEYKKKKDTVSVILSPNDGTWTVISDGKRQFNYNYQNKELVNRMAQSLLGIVAKQND